MDLLCEKVVSNAGTYQQLINDIEIPVNLWDAFERPSLPEVLSNMSSRYMK